MESEKYPVMLTIAGADPSGGAGIQADIRTATLLGVHPLSAITAVTAQNSRGVDSFIEVPASFLEKELSTVIDDMRPAAVKTGMMSSAAHLLVTAQTLERYELRNVVVDPVISPTSGNDLSADPKATMETAAFALFPLADLVTPNIPEAEAFLGHEIPDVAAQMDAAAEFCNRFKNRAVLLKGGHLPADDNITDIFFDSESQRVIQIPHRRIDTKNLHGTGCTLSSAVASYLALGKTLEQAVVFASRFVHRALIAGSALGIAPGNGPLGLFPEIINPE